MRYNHFLMRNAHLIAKWPAQSLGLVQHKGKRKGYRFRPHTQDGNELIYVDFGDAELDLSAKRLFLSAGDAVILPGDVRHSLRSSRAFSFMNIVYIGSIPSRIRSRILHLRPADRRTLAIIKQEASGSDCHKDEILLLQLNLLLLSLDRLSHSEGSTSLAGKNRQLYHGSVVMRALSYLRSHAGDALDAEAVARYAGVSASHLRRVVKRETGMTLSLHLRQIRIARARHLLLESEDNVDAIALAVGYTSVGHFCNLFKKETGMTPGEYARSLWLPPDDEYEVDFPPSP